jgi:hypothetical protein
MNLRKHVRWILVLVALTLAAVSYFGYVVIAEIVAAADQPVLTSFRKDDGVCLKQMRIVQTAISPKRAKEFGLEQTLCDKAENTIVRARLLHMLGDTFEVKCDAPGFAASAKSQFIFYWDRQPPKPELISLHRHKTDTTDGPVATPQCEKYGLRPWPQ